MRMSDRFVAAYMATCKDHAPDHNEIGMRYFKAAWATRDAEIERLKAELAENEGVINVWRRRCTETEAETEALRAAIRGALSALGTGRCGLCPCEGCEFEHADAMRELTDARQGANDE
jgi:hypothetical protein